MYLHQLTALLNNTTTTIGGVFDCQIQHLGTKLFNIYRHHLALVRYLTIRSLELHLLAQYGIWLSDLWYYTLWPNIVFDCRIFGIYTLWPNIVFDYQILGIIHSGRVWYLTFRSLLLHPLAEYYIWLSDPWYYTLWQSMVFDCQIFGTTPSGRIL